MVYVIQAARCAVSPDVYTYKWIDVVNPATDLINRTRYLRTYLFGISGLILVYVRYQEPLIKRTLWCYLSKKLCCLNRLKIL